MVDITNGTCIAHLLNSKVDKCIKINKEHAKRIEEITDEKTFLNQFNGYVKFENEKIKLNGL